MLPVVTLAKTGQPVARARPGIPLFDTECLRQAVVVKQVNYFARGQGNSDASGLIAQKSPAETNVNQQQQLPGGFRFDCLKINLLFWNNNPYTGPLSEQDYLGIVTGSLFTFNISQHEVAQLPLAVVPFGVSGEADGSSVAVVRTGSAHVTNALSLLVTVKDFPIIKAGEQFSANITWFQADGLTYAPVNNIRTLLLVGGVNYKPL